MAAAERGATVSVHDALYIAAAAWEDTLPLTAARRLAIAPAAAARKDYIVLLQDWRGGARS